MELIGLETGCLKEVELANRLWVEEKLLGWETDERGILEEMMEGGEVKEVWAEGTFEGEDEKVVGDEGMVFFRVFSSATRSLASLETIAGVPHRQVAKREIVLLLSFFLLPPG